MKKVSVRYSPSGVTLRRFHQSDAFVRVLIGPFGSGKTTSSLFEILSRAREQRADGRGRRKSRWLVARTTYPELTRSTIPEWRGLFGPEFGSFTQAPTPLHEMRIRHRDDRGEIDGTVVEADVYFMAFDSASAAESLRSMVFTGAFLHEMKQFEKPVLDMITGRVGRYPHRRDGGPTWHGVWGDTNAPDRDHWLYRLAEEDRPEGWEVFRQPAGVLKDDKGRWRPNPGAENVENLPAGYYEKQVAGKTEDWIRVNLANEYGYVVDGKPVYAEWRDTTHVAAVALEPVPKLPIFVGLDFGLTPAAVFAQRTARGQWRVIDELVTEDMGVKRFAGLLAGRLAEWYDGFEVTMWGDPAGGARAQTDETTCFDIVKAETGYTVREAPSQDIVLRTEAVAGALNRMIDGDPGFVLSPGCSVLRRGFAGGYRYRRMKVSGEERYHDVPEKNKASHPHDALQYLMLGAGEGAAVVGRHNRELSASSAPADTEGDYAVLRA